VVSVQQDLLWLPAVKTKLPLSTRVFHCRVCGLVLDRDLNAARNLARLAELVEEVAGSGPETQTARGGDVRPGLARRSPVKREAGTGLAGSGQTGTVAPQGAAARITTIADDR
jgi:hypothetical protein